jgi:hypothetical protein
MTRKGGKIIELPRIPTVSLTAADNQGKFYELFRKISF